MEDVGGGQSRAEREREMGGECGIKEKERGREEGEAISTEPQRDKREVEAWFLSHGQEHRLTGRGAD